MSDEKDVADTLNKCPSTEKLRGQCECRECKPPLVGDEEFKALVTGKRKAIEIEPELSLKTLDARLKKLEDILEEFGSILPRSGADRKIKRNKHI